LWKFGGKAKKWRILRDPAGRRLDESKRCGKVAAPQFGFLQIIISIYINELDGN